MHPSPRHQTVELEEKLGGQATQHREVQGHESDKFMSYFADGVMYTSGGVDSAFIHVDKSTFETRLLHVKGRKNIRSRQVPLMRSSLNDGDVFILDAGSVIYQVHYYHLSVYICMYVSWSMMYVDCMFLSPYLPCSSTARQRRVQRRRRLRRLHKTSRTSRGAARPV